MSKEKRSNKKKKDVSLKSEIKDIKDSIKKIPSGC